MDVEGMPESHLRVPVLYRRLWLAPLRKLLLSAVLSLSLSIYIISSLYAFHAVGYVASAQKHTNPMSPFKLTYKDWSNAYAKQQNTLTSKFITCFNFL